MINYLDDKRIEEISRKCKIKKSDKFDVIVIDPPWNQGKTSYRGVRPNQGTKLDYPTLLFDDICNIPVEKWAKKGSFVFLWVTNSKDKKTKKPIIQMGFELLEKWNLTYYTTITWDKKTGPCPFGPFQIITEHLLFAYKGSADFNKESMGKMKTCFTESSSAHSVKPDSFYQLIHEHFIGKKLDVFARQKRIGFKGWGNEYGTYSLDIKKRELIKAKKQLKLRI